MIEKYLNLCKGSYKEPHRYFHDWNHISFGLNFFENLNKGTLDQKIAWLFHDIVYNPSSKNNELDSSIIAVNTIKKQKDEDIISLNKVSTIILDTKEHIPTIEESKLVLDIDMAVLGLPEYDDFLNYRILAAQEYAHFGKDAVVSGTKKFIEQTLNKNRIYFSNDFLDFEYNARKNLEIFYSTFENNKRFNNLFKTSKIKLKL